MKPLFISIPHSGERVPPEATWLLGLAEPHLMCDVDRYVDWLYLPAIQRWQLASVVTEWHRYVVDLNRLVADVDCDSVEGSAHPSGNFPQGLHWLKTTRGQPLLQRPLTQSAHQQLVQKYFEPFHAQVRAVYAKLKAQGHTMIYHLDAHSMPSMGTLAHRDPGQRRADVVVSDWQGKSCRSEFKDLVVAAYEQAGFKVSVNWPYFGGRVTQTYGQPAQGQHAIQVELNRALYMNEDNKQRNDRDANNLREKLIQAIGRIYQELPR